VWIGRLGFVAIAIASILYTHFMNRSLQRYLKAHHPQEWESIYQEGLFKKALLWPFMRNTPVDFLWSSREDFGDPTINQFRQRIRRALVSAIAAGVASVIWFVLSEALLP
jgi:hypothetical protein